MKKYKLIAVGGGSHLTGEYENVVSGFKEAEEQAKELLHTYIDDYPDAEVACFQYDEMVFDDDYLFYSRDWNGEEYWKMKIWGGLVSVGDRLLEEDEEELLRELREASPVNIFDLSEDELKELRSEICVGSILLDDYTNSFEIEQYELLGICDCYIEWLEKDEDGGKRKEIHQDTPENFADFIRNHF